MTKLRPEPAYWILAGGRGLCLSMISTASMVYQINRVGLNPLQLVLVGTTLELSVFLFEVPTGVVADVYSRRLSIIIGMFLIGLGFIVQGSLPVFTAVLAAQVLWGVGFTFTSGATQAWIVDEVGEANAGRVFLRGSQMKHACDVIGIGLGAALGSVAINLPILLGGGMLMMLAAFLAFTMPENGFAPKASAQVRAWLTTGLQAMAQTLKDGMRLVRVHPALLTIFGIGLFYGLYSEGYDRLSMAHVLKDMTLPSLGGLQPAFILSDGLPQTFPVPPQLIPTFDNGLNTPVYRPRDANRLPYSQQWNLTIEREFTSQDYVAVSYVGNKGTRLLSQVDPINALNPSFLTSLGAQLNDVFQPGETELDGVPAPFPNFAATIVGCAPSVAQALLPFPQYCNGITARNENQGNSTYHSFQLKAEHRFSKGLWVLLTYTNSKLLTDADASENIYGSTVFSPFQPQKRKSLAFEDVPQALNIAYNYDLPFGAGRRWLSHGGFVTSVLGGWTVNGVFRAQSGIPFQITSSFCNVPEQIRAQCIPGLLAGASPSAQSLSHLDVSQPYLNVSSFESINDFNFYTGNGPRTQNFRQPGYSDFDMGLQKTFHVSERVTFQLRGDAFNVFNHVNFRLPGRSNGGTADITNPGSFGFITTSAAPRSMQFALRLDF